MDKKKCDNHIVGAAYDIDEMGIIYLYESDGDMLAPELVFDYCPRCGEDLARD